MKYLEISCKQTRANMTVLLLGQLVPFYDYDSIRKCVCFFFKSKFWLNMYLSSLIYEYILDLHDSR